MKNVMQFLGEVKAEMFKVVWPKFDDLGGATIVVLVIVSAFALYLFSIDLIFSRLASLVFKTYGVY